MSQKVLDEFFTHWWSPGWFSASATDQPSQIFIYLSSEMSQHLLDGLAQTVV